MVLLTAWASVSIALMRVKLLRQTMMTRREGDGLLNGIVLMLLTFERR